MKPKNAIGIEEFCTKEIYLREKEYEYIRNFRKPGFSILNIEKDDSIMWLLYTLSWYMMNDENGDISLVVSDKVKGESLLKTIYDVLMNNYIVDSGVISTHVFANKVIFGKNVIRVKVVPTSKKDVCDLARSLTDRVCVFIDSDNIPHFEELLKYSTPAYEAVKAHSQLNDLFYKRLVFRCKEQDTVEVTRTLTTGFYKHFKGVNSDGEQMVYLVHDIAEHTETGEKLVMYQAMYGDLILYARPLDMFMSRVDKVAYPDSQEEFRFVKMPYDELKIWSERNIELYKKLIQKSLLPIKHEKTLTLINV